MSSLKEDAQLIIKESIKNVLPDKAVEKALSGKQFPGDVIVVAMGKAAWTMAKAARNILGNSIKKGIVITKYNHSQGAIEGFDIIEAGHPVPDENSVLGTNLALQAVSGLKKEDQVIFLISGGGSALFEKPAEGITLDDIKTVTEKLLQCGANIIEINTIRKRLSQVKGGRFAAICKPAALYSIVLSDVIGDRLDSIASGPAYPDNTTAEEAMNIIRKYNLNFSEAVKESLKQETPKELENVETVITGSVSRLCRAVADSAKNLGYSPYILTTTLECEAREAGHFFSSIAREIQNGTAYGFKTPCAIIAGGETTVKLCGKGLGGRNQELAYSAAKGIAGMKEVLLFSLGSDGTDGPTEAAGGMVDGETYDKIISLGLDYEKILDNNDSYHGLKAADGLIVTGPTGTNVNDVMVVLCR